VVGVAPQARLWPTRCALPTARATIRRHLGHRPAVADGAKVINMSLGDTVYSQALADAVEAAWNAGVVDRGRRRQRRRDAPFYPAALDHVVAVGAFDESTSAPRSPTTAAGWTSRRPAATSSRPIR
jgi:subtilisin family serine protease